MESSKSSDKVCNEGKQNEINFYQITLLLDSSSALLAQYNILASIASKLNSLGLLRANKLVHLQF